MESALEKIYNTPVLKTKQEDFIAFLRELGITKDELILVGNRGDYYIYQIELSSKDNSSYNSIRHELNKNQVEFL